MRIEKKREAKHGSSVWPKHALMQNALNLTDLKAGEAAALRCDIICVLYGASTAFVAAFAMGLGRKLAHSVLLQAKWTRLPSEHAEQV